MKAILALMLCFIISSAHSQSTFTVSGIIATTDGMIIPHAEVLLLSAQDNTVIMTALAVNGTFNFGSVPSGEYALHLISNGFEDFYRTLTIAGDENLNLTLTPASIKALDAVVVESKRKTFNTANGNIKVDIANSIFKSISNPLDLLAKLPGVIISPDKESLSIIGKGSPLIYIDNQQVGMNELNALSVDDIKTIEIINNPSSKYEANGRVVVLITRKLSKKEGYKIIMSETASFKKKFNNYSGVNASIKKKRTEFKGSFNYNYVQPWEGAASSLELPGENITTSNHAVSFSEIPQSIFGAGLYHQINDDDYFSASANARMQDDKHYNRFKTYYSKAETEQNIVTLSDNEGSRKYFNTFVNYNKKIKSLDATLFTGLQYSGFRQAVLSDIRNSFDGGTYAPAQDSDQRFTVDAFSGRADIEKTFKNEMELEVGGMYLSANANTNFQVDNYENTASTHTEYHFTEKNLAAYTQLTGKIQQLTYSAGLRSETTDIKGGYANDTNLLVDKHYANLFPKLQLDYAIDSTHTISVNYAKSISRPNYSSTSQVTVYNSPYVSFTRNINLDPAIADQLFANYQYKDFSFKISYTFTTNPTYYTYSYDEVQNLFNFSGANLKQERTYMLETTLPFTYKFWSSTTMLAGVLNKVEDDAAVLKTAKPYGYYYTNHTFKLPEEYSFMISLWGVTHRLEGVFDKNAFSSVDVSASKTFFGTLDCSIGFSDIFRGQTFDDNFTRNNIITRSTFYTDSHEFVISLKYNFGKIKDSTFKERKVDEGNRVN